MDHLGSEYAVIINDPHLRQGIIRDAGRSRRSGLGANSSQMLRRWLADALHELASCVDPAARTVDLRPAQAPSSQALIH